MTEQLLTAMTQRIVRELEHIEKSDDGFYSVCLENDDITRWKVTFFGPEKTPYENGVFVLSVIFPKEYPSTAPTIKFLSKVYHPNINMQGDVCLAQLKEWSPSTSVRSLMFSILSILQEPAPKDSLEVEIGKLYISNRDRFKEIAKEWTKKYANSGSIKQKK